MIKFIETKDIESLTKDIVYLKGRLNTIETQINIAIPGIEKISDKHSSSDSIYSITKDEIQEETLENIKNACRIDLEKSYESIKKDMILKCKKLLSICNGGDNESETFCYKINITKDVDPEIILKSIKDGMKKGMLFKQK